jgi:hypothetical protein
LYRLQLVLGGAGLAVCAIVLGAGVRAVHVSPARAHRADVGGLSFAYPAVNAAAVVLLALAAVGAAVLVSGATATWRQVRGYRRLVRALPSGRPLAGDHSVLVVQTSAPLAFCAGWVRPRVYISSGALERLSPSEVRAVLAHEQHHGALRDPLRLAISRVLCQALFFLPVLRSLHTTYADAAELTADAAALEALEGATAPLASAMLALDASQRGSVTGISGQRVDALLGLPVHARLPRLLLVGALATLAVLVALAWRASASASVHTTLNLPIASSQPCVLVLALLPIVGLGAALIGRGALPGAQPRPANA